MRTTLKYLPEPLSSSCLKLSNIPLLLFYLGSDDEFNNNDKGSDPAHIPTSSSTYQQEQYNEANTEPTGDSTQGPASSLSSVSVHRLPSFKRRERSKEEDEQLEQLRQELRKNRQSDHDDERADIPKDPQQGKIILHFKCILDS